MQLETQVVKKSGQGIELTDSTFPKRKTLVFTDTLPNQQCGVSVSLKMLNRVFEEAGQDIQIYSAKKKFSSALPAMTSGIWITYKKFRDKYIQRIEEEQPDHVHICTEGPIGWHVRNYCCENDIAFSSSFHTVWPEYVPKHVEPLLSELGMLQLEKDLWKFFRIFHEESGLTMTRTQSMLNKLAEYGYNQRLGEWNGGVDLSSFSPKGNFDQQLTELKKRTNRPILLYVGRISPEKNLAVIEELKDLPVEIVLVGKENKFSKALQKEYRKQKNIHFLGGKKHSELPAIYRAADAFIFPSLTDTFGVVLIEALACGLPVIGFDAPGSRDIVTEQYRGKIGIINNDFLAGAQQMLQLIADGQIKPNLMRERSSTFSHEKVANQFAQMLVKAY